MNGFGWSFYGFFVGAAAWIAAYVIWSIHAAASERRGRR